MTMTVCDINLIAGRRRQKQRAIVVLRLATYSVLALLIAVATVYCWLAVETRFAAGQIADVEAQLHDPVLADKVGRVQFLESNIAGLKPRVDLLEKVHDSEAAWIRILRDVSACIPSDVWVTQFSSQRIDKVHSLSIKGRALNQKDIGQSMLAVDGPSWSGVPKLGFTQATSLKDGRSYIDFEITVPLTKIIGSDLR